jgi:2-polyprenyl-6-methoxyphenol hydroxylase-like FAD-dependent oxidoreductase
MPSAEIARSVRALVIGGGIGGLCAGIAVRQAGLDAVVFEQAAKLDEIGAGLALSRNAFTALGSLGLADDVRSRGAVTSRLQIRTWRGDVLVELVPDEPELEVVGIHRAALQAALVEALDRDALALGKRCVAATDEGDGVVARFADGSEERGDLLVGADGIDSVVREGLFGLEEPRYAGYVGWRAVAGEDVGRTVSESWGAGLRVGIVPIAEGRVYWFVSENSPERGRDLFAADKAALRERLRDWHDPIPALVDTTDEQAILGTGIYDRRPGRHWGRGRVTLVGDAAHPVTPNLGQGAALAIEDAVVLAACLRRQQTVRDALRRYERLRRRRVAPIVRQSWRFGRLAQAESRPGCALRDVIVRLIPERLGRAQRKRLVAFEIP